MSVYVTSKKKQIRAFLTEGPKAVFIEGGKRSTLAIESLNIILGTIGLLAEGVHVSAFYDIPASSFMWKSPDGLVTMTNPSASVSGDIFTYASGAGTLIQRKRFTDPAFSTAIQL